MFHKFYFKFDELGIVADDLHKLLGFNNNEIPDPFSEYINTALHTAPQLCEITGGFKIFEAVNINNDNKTIEIEKQCFSPSKIVTTQLKKSNKIAVFLCTVGAGISDYSKRLSIESDPVLAYVFDVLGSIAVERATDKLQEILKSQANKTGLNISDRYSPGYCEWSVAEQHKLFSLLPDDFCGIKLSDSALMHPIKSVSGIIGIGKEVQQNGYQCQWCTDKNCIYGKIKRR